MLAFHYVFVDPVRVVEQSFAPGSVQTHLRSDQEAGDKRLDLFRL